LPLSQIANRHRHFLQDFIRPCAWNSGDAASSRAKSIRVSQYLPGLFKL
jgi:hypothetical protein